MMSLFFSSPPRFPRLFLELLGGIELRTRAGFGSSTPPHTPHPTHPLFSQPQAPPSYGPKCGLDFETAPERKAPDDGVGGWLRPKEMGIFKVVTRKASKQENKEVAKKKRNAPAAKEKQKLHRDLVIATQTRKRRRRSGTHLRRRRNGSCIAARKRTRRNKSCIATRTRKRRSRSGTHLRRRRN
jgi:hypothetical protein